ncbi:putative polyadenylate-binding protein [Monocercomonoides exilis]|uniref:putative polyadenylate-binding protein n=1 Tax=Monocercomonoides exilis TaxID=2049356 RepID=UPI0035594345|nr:putative polyadenylate-binding protein [Monocercomonoides exilis]
MAHFGSASSRTHDLFIGDLTPEITKEHIVNFILEKLGPNTMVTAMVCYDHNAPGRSLCHGYINFQKQEDAEKALNICNYTAIVPGGKPCRLMWAQPDATLRRSGAANVCVKNLPSTFENKQLHDEFSDCGTILSCRVSEFNRKKGRPTHGFVQFETKDMAQKSIDQKNGKEIEGLKLIVEFARPFDQYVHRTCFISQLDPETTEDDLKEFVKEIEEPKKAIVIKNSEGVSRQFGFVWFETKEKAQECVDKMNGQILKGKPAKVMIALSKWERLRYKRQLREMTKFRNLYIRGFPTDFDDDKLREIFAVHGPITSCKVMKSEQGISRGYGFCCFEKDEDARKAYLALNGQKIEGTENVLLVNYAQPRSDRLSAFSNQVAMRAPRTSFYGMPLTSDMQQMMAMTPQMMEGAPFLQSGAMQNRMRMGRTAGGMAGMEGVAGMMNQMGMMGPGAGAMGPTGGAALRQPHAGRGVGGAMGAMMGQMNAMGHVGAMGGMGRQTQGQHALIPGIPGQRGGVPILPGMGPGYPTTPSGPMMSTPSSLMSMGTPTSQVGSGVSVASPASQGVGSASTTPSMTPMTPSSNISTPNQQPQVPTFDPQRLASLNPDDQKQYIGEFLYPTIQNEDPVCAGKITGMILELDISELIRLYQKKEDLLQKVKEAQLVLKNAGQV